MFYSLHVVEPLRYDSVLIKETNEWMNDMYILIMNEANSNLLFQYYIKRNETQSHEYQMISTTVQWAHKVKI